MLLWILVVLLLITAIAGGIILSKFLFLVLFLAFVVLVIRGFSGRSA